MPVRKRSSNSVDETIRLYREVKDLQEEATKYREGFIKYAQHLSSCNIIQAAMSGRIIEEIYCDCGLSKEFGSLRKKQ